MGVMTNADKIRKMSDEQLARFLWIWKINSVTAFLTQGGMNSNIAENLEWCTYEENNKWSMVNGRKAMRPEWLEKICKTRKTKAVVGTNIKTGEKVYFKSMRATKEIGADPSDVSRCCRGLKESSGGYRWSLLEAEEEEK